MSKPTLASLQAQIDELKRQVQKLQNDNQSKLEQRAYAERQARGEVR